MSVMMNRREALQRVALLMGGALSAPAILGVLNGCSAKPGAAWTPEFLTPEQGALLAEVAEIMIPRTDTPGAKDVGVPAFIDSMLKNAYGKEDQQRFLGGLEEFEAKARSEHGRVFLELDVAQRAALVRSAHDVAMVEERQSDLRPELRQRPFILMTKELALLGYFTSQVGATQILQYNPVPGAFVACSSLAEAGNGKTWATEITQRF